MRTCSVGFAYVRTYAWLAGVLGPGAYVSCSSHVETNLLACFSNAKWEVGGDPCSAEPGVGDVRHMLTVERER